MLATICDRCGKPTVPFRKYEAVPAFPYYLCKLKNPVKNKFSFQLIIIYKIKNVAKKFKKFF